MVSFLGLSTSQGVKRPHPAPIPAPTFPAAARAIAPESDEHVAKPLYACSHDFPRLTETKKPFYLFYLIRDACTSWRVTEGEGGTCHICDATQYIPFPNSFRTHEKCKRN
ncbi:hypothetical protein Pyn_19958 [Prunus yedoensis var. nudiflora]|uniref:Uncharacterized protein n=1 Tax=Prunus yedoensis var. nudiflora TaxID=2094558 RepID=A0A314ZJZ2_PRUYE|nr:hypothetical protein Pyn_19958 [Prunus yedoensis var. nudiflora]